MAKQSSINIVGVKPTSVAMFEGTFAAVLGLGVAILYSLTGTFKLAASTSSIFAGLAFGLTAGVVAIIVLPLAYFGIGWVIGYIHGWIFDVIAKSSGGIEIKTEE